MSSVLEFDVEIEEGTAAVVVGADEQADSSAIAVVEADQIDASTAEATASDAAEESTEQELSDSGSCNVSVPAFDSEVEERWELADDSEEAKLKAEWESAMESLEHEISNLTIERMQLGERAKSIKKRIDCLAEELSDLRISGPRKLTRKPVDPSAGSSEQGVTPNTNQAPPLSSSEQPPMSDDWRSAKLEQLNLKKNIHEKLVESSVETIGQLEDLRAAISLGKKEWPKGIGKAKITQIEDAVIDWLTKHRDSGVFQSVGGIHSAGTVVSTTEATPTSPPPANVPTNDEWNDWTDAQRSLYLTERAVALSSDQKDDLKQRLPDTGYWESGRLYFGQGSEIIDCPYTPGDWQDDWIRGFLSADMAGQPEEQAEPAESVDEEPTLEDEANTAVGSPEITLADL